MPCIYCGHVEFQVREVNLADFEDMKVCGDFEMEIEVKPEMMNAMQRGRERLRRWIAAIVSRLAGRPPR